MTFSIQNSFKKGKIHNSLTPWELI